MSPRFPRILPAALVAPAALGPASAGHSRARACKVFDGNVNGTADGGEQLVADWRFRLTDSRGGSIVRTTGEDGCALFTELRVGRYALSEIAPPQWPTAEGSPRGIEVSEPRERGEPATSPSVFVSSCVHFARMGSTAYWRGEDGLRALDERDRRFLNALDPFQATPAHIIAGAIPFDGRFSDALSPRRGARGDLASWSPVSWQAKVALYLGDPSVSADPRGRLSQELVAFGLNTRHLLEHAEMVYVEGMPIFVDDLIFEGIAAWHSDKASWMRDMTELLAALNGTAVLAYVPRHHCQVAYLPF